MAQRTSRSSMAAHTHFDRLRARHIEEHGFISCTTAITVATKLLAERNAEVSLLFCDLARDLLTQSQTWVQRSYIE